MLRVECDSCPHRDAGCNGCLVDWFLDQKPQVESVGEESCGYVLEEGIRDAIEVLRAAGLVGDLRILEVVTAA